MITEQEINALNEVLEVVEYMNRLDRGKYSERFKAVLAMARKALDQLAADRSVLDRTQKPT